MCAGVIEVLALEIDFRAAEIACHFLSEIKPRGAVCVFIEQRFKFSIERRIIFIMVIRLFEFDHSIHERFGDILSAVNAESSVWICHKNLLNI